MKDKHVFTVKYICEMDVYPLVYSDKMWSVHLKLAFYMGEIDACLMRQTNMPV